MTRHQLLLAAWLAWGLAASGTPPAFAIPSPVEAERQAIAAEIATASIKLAQAQPAQAPAPQSAPASAPAAAQPADDDPIGNVATLTGSASVTRNNVATALKLKHDIFRNDVLQTSANSTLGVTFNDATTFNLTANARITVDNFIYEDGGKANAALFNVAKGTVAFVAAAVAKSGDMKISTPTATIGIRGTSGLVEVPESTTAGGTNNVAVKLYADPDGRVGRIEINDRAGARLGILTQGASGFTIRPTLGGGRFAAVPLLISPQQALRDQGFVRQVHAAQTVGRQIVAQQRALRRANPARQPGLQRQQPGLQQPGRRGQPGAPPGSPRPGQLGQPGVQQPGAPGLQRPGQIRPVQPRRPGAAAPRQRPPKERR